jgi:hypothetical protein
MRELSNSYSDKLSILLFPCNSFGAQVSHPLLSSIFHNLLMVNTLESFVSNRRSLVITPR